MRISQLTLHTENIQIMKEFYATLLDFPVAVAEEDKFAIQVGWTELVFQQDTQFDMFYHFALNIPENQIIPSIAWLKSLGIEILSYEGDEVIEFGDPFNADACYFHDPAGNIVEFIARHRLPNSNDSDFSQDKIECVSEIGLPTDDVRVLSTTLCNKLDLDVFDGENSDGFTAIGDDEGLFIVVQEGRGWLPTGRQSTSCPLKVVLSNHQMLSVTNSGRATVVALPAQTRLPQQ